MKRKDAGDIAGVFAFREPNEAQLFFAAAAFFAAGFLATAFLRATGFFALDAADFRGVATRAFFAAAFFAGAFLAVLLRAVFFIVDVAIDFFAGLLRADFFAADFLAVDFFADFFAAVFFMAGMVRLRDGVERSTASPVNRRACRSEPCRTQTRQPGLANEARVPAAPRAWREADYCDAGVWTGALPTARACATGQTNPRAL